MPTPNYISLALALPLIINKKPSEGLLNEEAAEQIRQYRADYNNRPSTVTVSP